MTIVSFLACARPLWAADPSMYLRVSAASDGTQANGWSDHPALSANGRCVAFESNATNLVPGDTNGVTDIFVHDLATHTTTRESIAGGGAQANGASTFPSISDDCRFVAFKSDATNLAAGPVSTTTQIYVRDRVAGSTALVSASSSGAPGNGVSDGAAISGDGRFVSFRSQATNLVSGDTNGCVDIFTRDLIAGVTTRDSVSSGGEQALCERQYADPGWPSLSRDGRYVAFDSGASNLVAGLPREYRAVFVRDRVAGRTSIVSPSTAIASSPAISGDGRYVSYQYIFGYGHLQDLAIRDRLTGETVSLTSFIGGISRVLTSTPRISADGRFISFWEYYGPQSRSTTWIYDRIGRTSREVASDLSDQPAPPSVVAAGRVALFSTSATIVSNDTNGLQDVFVMDFGDVEPPGAPRNLTFAVLGSTATLSWLPPADGGPVSYYIIEKATKPMGSDSSPSATTGTTYSTTIDENGPYYIRLRAANSLGQSVPSNEVVLAGPASSPPGPPTMFRAASSGSTVTLMWTAPVLGGPVQAYSLGAGDNESSARAGRFDIDPAVSTLTIPGVPAGSYYLYLRGKNDAGFSAYSNEASVIVLETGPCSRPPDAPSDLRASVTGGIVDLSWNPTDATSSYLVEAGASRGASDLANVDTGGVIPALMTPVPTGTYFVRVRARNDCGVGPASNEVVIAVSNR